MLRFGSATARVRSPLRIHRPSCYRTTVLIDPRRTFATIIRNAGDERGLQIVRRAVGTARERPNPVLLSGPSGSGKTHWLHAMANELTGQHPVASVRMVTAEQYMTAYVASIRGARTREFQSRITDCDALLVDEMEDLSGKPATQEFLFDIIRTQVERGKLIVLSSGPVHRAPNRPLERAVAAFPCGAIVRLRAPTLTQRIGALRRLLRERGMHVSPHVLQATARRARTIPEAASALERAMLLRQLA